MNEDGVMLADGFNTHEEDEVGRICNEDADITSRKAVTYNQLIDGTRVSMRNEDQTLIEEETNATVLLGRNLGAVNLESFHAQGIKEASFVLLQETQHSSLERVDISGYWGNGGFNHEFVESGRYGEVVNILNVYGPQGVNEKRLLWDIISLLVETSNGLWVVAGDFNVVRSKEDRRNSNFDASSAKDFNDFVEEADLHEYSLKGNRFTFCMGTKMGRIDRIFVCWSLFNKWQAAEYRALPRFRSGHCPLILKTESRNFGPKPFRFFNSWLDRTDFDKVVELANGEYMGLGPPDLFLMMKFKFLRQRINKWKDEKFKMEHEEQLGLQTELASLEETLMDRDLVESEQWVWEEIKKRLYEIDEFKFNDLKQKARNN
ncbi:uncharacterized protein LOC143604289 [Bidens hawaiensis]|uniref:uncharacterized protein LOC143604289 n=1 Tax=Bidens hawaiensis TaxID=980011 RepID=UPI004048FA4B